MMFHRNCACLLAAMLGLLPGTSVLAQADKLTPGLSAQPRARVILADRIVAVVNDDIVTLRELEERIRIVKSQLSRQNVALPADDVLQTQVLERVIVDRAQLHFAREIGLRVDDNQLDRAVARIAEENRMTPAQFRDAVERDGVPFNRFREDIRLDILINRLRQNEVESKIVINEGEIDNFLAQDKTATTEQEINLGHILVRVPESATPDQIEARRKRAEEALAQLRGGAEFGKVSASFSDSPEALTGGVLGMRPVDRLPQLFVDAVERLRKDEVSAVVRSPNGFHILKVIERRSGDTKVSVQQTKARHILIRTSEIVSQDQARRRLVELRERLANKAAEFCDLARQFSADGSASRCGDLGTIYPGDTVPEFEQAMNALAPGELSQPVQTQFGWHLIQVMERGAGGLSVERERQAARQALRERKVDEAYQEWLRQLRDRAFVEYRLEDR